jgi:hypothetical protein
MWYLLIPTIPIILGIIGYISSPKEKYYENNIHDLNPHHLKGEFKRG